MIKFYIILRWCDCVYFLCDEMMFYCLVFMFIVFDGLIKILKMEYNYFFFKWLDVEY